MRSAANVARLAPYAGLARSYDIALGRGSLSRVTGTLRRLIRRYGIAFRSAADIGCGTGLFAAHLAKHWRIPVFAVDRSKSMLREAFRNGSARHACMLCQDIRMLTLPRPVDLITANFDTINHVINSADVAETFRRVHGNLRPGGHFIFDFVTDKQPWLATQVYVRRLPAHGCDVAQRIVWDPLRKLIIVALTQRWPRLGIRTVENHVERAYAPLDMARWLRDTGFSIRAILDAATLEQAHARSRRIVVVAHRGGSV
jgi:SAM-dependent methyltransferase